jgi:hypothetical protein
VVTQISDALYEVAKSLDRMRDIFDLASRPLPDHTSKLLEKDIKGHSLTSELVKLIEDEIRCRLPPTGCDRIEKQYITSVLLSAKVYMAERAGMGSSGANQNAVNVIRRSPVPHGVFKLSHIMRK